MSLPSWIIPGMLMRALLLKRRISRRDSRTEGSHMRRIGLRAPLAVASLVLAAALGLVGLARAEDWPQRPVRIIGPYAAGGNADVLARPTPPWLTDPFRRPFVL